jgi:uncharacterized membrane protein YcfT
MPAQAREKWLDVARGLSICLVVFYHTSLWFEAYGSGSAWFLALNQLFRPIRLPLFFLISGLLARNICLGEGTRGAYRRIGSCLYLYGLWSAILWVEFHFVDCNQRQIPFGTSSYDFVTLWYRPENGFWTLWALAIHIGLARCLRRFDARRITFAALMLSGVFMSRADSWLNFAQLGAIWYFPFFCLGVYHGKAITELLSRAGLRHGVMATGAFVACGVLVTKVQDPWAFGMLRLTTCLFGLSVTCLLCVKLCARGGSLPIIDYIGRNTAPIFLANEGAEALLTKVAMAHLTEAVVSPASCAPVVTLLTIAVALALRVVSRSLGMDFLFALPARLETAHPVATIRRLVPGSAGSGRVAAATT